jgi:hypothetical protein
VGLPLPRIAIRQVRESGQWAGYFKPILGRCRFGTLKLRKLIHPVLSNIDQTPSGPSGTL